MQVPVMDSGGVFKDWTNLHKVDTVTTDITSMDADTLYYWLSKFVLEVANSEEKRYPARAIDDLICALRRHLMDVVGSETLNPLDAGDMRYVSYF